MNFIFNGVVILLPFFYAFNSSIVAAQPSINARESIGIFGATPSYSRFRAYCLGVFKQYYNYLRYQSFVQNQKTNKGFPWPA